MAGGSFTSPWQPSHSLQGSISEPQFRPGYDDREMSARPGVKGRDHLATASTTALALYSSPSYGSLYVEPEDLEPGPGQYDIPQGMGHQMESTKESAPCRSLTAKHEKSWAKVMISKAHCNAFKAQGTPGPGTYEPEMPRAQGRIRFGTSQRNSLCDTKFRSPGAVYNTRSMPDKPEVSSTSRSLPNTRFSKSNRFASDNDSLSRALGNTGPGMYEVPCAIDGHRLAKSFGCGHRAYDKVRFPGSERAMVGRASPGPGAARDFQSDGPKRSFGKAERLPPNNDSKRAPGPGAYEHDRPCPFSKSKPVYSFGRPHARGRLDLKQLKFLGNSAWMS